MDSSTLKHITHTYRDGAEATALNTLDVWLPETNLDGNNPEGFWIVFIHGGAWRDPLITSTSFLPALSILSSPPPTTSTNTSTPPIAGYASLNYRLSPYPSHSTSPSTPTDASRSAKHPDHLDDVTAALLFLEEKYRIGGRYLLVGHSCGATLAFQVPQTDERSGREVPKAVGIIGSEGIYDIPSLLERNAHPFYRDFITAAFGEDEETWVSASPCLAMDGSLRLWEGAGVVLISHSEEDEYVEVQQSRGMLERVRGGNKGEVAFVEVVGRHDEVHEKGGELARIIGVGVEMVWVVGWGRRWGDVRGEGAVEV